MSVVDGDADKTDVTLGLGVGLRHLIQGLLSCLLHAQVRDGWKVAPRGYVRLPDGALRCHPGQGTHWQWTSSWGS